MHIVYLLPYNLLTILVYIYTLSYTYTGSVRSFVPPVGALRFGGRNPNLSKPSILLLMGANILHYCLPVGGGDLLGMYTYILVIHIKYCTICYTTYYFMALYYDVFYTIYILLCPIYHTLYIIHYVSHDTIHIYTMYIDTITTCPKFWPPSAGVCPPCSPSHCLTSTLVRMCIIYYLYSI